MKKYVKLSADSAKDVEALKLQNDEAEAKIKALAGEAKEAKDSLASRDELIANLRSENELLKRNLAAEKIQELVRGTMSRMKKSNLEKSLKSKVKSEAWVFCLVWEVPRQSETHTDYLCTVYLSAT